MPDAVTYTRFASVAFPFALAGLGLLGFLHLRGGQAAPSSAAPPPLAVRAAPTARQAAFDSVYENATWGKNAEGVGYSGNGSTLESTFVYRAFLQQFLEQHDIHSVVDAGCGDWEFSRTIDWTGIDYQGFDIVEAVVEANRLKYGRPNIRFFTADIVETDLPPADLLIVKHVLQHLPTADVHKVLAQLPKYKHVLLVDGVNAATLTADNADIEAGEYRELDLLRPPFSVKGAKVLLYSDGMHMHQVVHAAPRKSGD